MEINAFDYNGNESTHVIPDEFDYLHVEIFSGDEVIDAIKIGKNKLPRFVAHVDGLQNENRYVGYPDGDYDVAKNDIERWKTRKNPDDGFLFASEEEGA